MVITICQATFTDVTEATVSATAPQNPYKGQSWTDTSKTPPAAKVWDGTKWVDKLSEVEEELKDHTEKLSSHDAKISANETAISLRVTTQEYEANKAVVDGQLKTMSSSLSSAQSSIDVLQGQIALKVEQADIEEALGEYSTTAQMNAAITAAKDEIDLSVSSTYAKQTDLATVSGKVSSLESWKTEASQKITKDGIIATVGNYYAYQSDLASAVNRLTSAESTISQQADQIALRVEKSGVISAINQTAESIKINANKVNLTGYVTMTNLSTSGQTTINGANIKTGTISADRIDVTGLFAKDITATGTIRGVNLVGATGSFSGTITAGGGTIAGWNIASWGIYKSDTSGDGKTKYVCMASDFYDAKNDNPYNPVFGIQYNNDWKFYVRSNGDLMAKNATITGTINATGGTFSGNINCTGTITGANLVGASGTFLGDISGSTFTGGQIKSTNYVQGSSGTLINLNDGSISTYYTYSSPVITNGVNSAFLSSGQLRLVAPDASMYPMTNSATSEVIINGYEISFSHTSGNQIMSINVAGLTTSGWVDASQIIGDSFLCDGWMTVNGQAQLNGGVFAPYMELSAPTPYIDFHYNKTTTDYTARIIADGAGGANSLRIYARGGLYLTGGTFIVEAQDSANEGGEIRLNGAGSNKQVCIDNLSGNFRVYTQNPYKIMTWNASTGGLELPYGGLSVSSIITSSYSSGTWLGGNNGNAIICSTASGSGFNMLARMLAPAGRFIMGQYQGDFLLAYTRNSTVSAGTNSVDALAKLLNNNGNSLFPGTVTAASHANSSLAELKTEITLVDQALPDILKTDVYSYYLKRDLANGVRCVKYGFVIGEGYRLTDKVLSEDKDAIELYSAIGLLWRGEQELHNIALRQASRMDTAEARMESLQYQLSQAFAKIAEQGKEIEQLRTQLQASA